MKPSVKFDHDLHVMLIQTQDNCKKPLAILIAYQEGPGGRLRRLGLPELPLENKEAKK